ncbi:hypothetical protein [Halococcus qingdaonensis]|uniref:hypothetical protein n=1 Tax=Halococcus qingdaonensis TaxID=224402 RepID=UPI00211680C8|nr:hypothetical protein [Halococcus qingdaonensis]
MSKDTHGSSKRTLATIALVTVVLLSAGAAVSFTASAAGSTTVSFSPQSSTVAAGEMATYDIVVDNTDNGVGTTNASIELSNPSVGEITNIELAGSPADSNVNITDDGSAASFDVIYFGNALSGDADGVTVATVTVNGTATGESALTLDVNEISDSAGGLYDVTETTPGTLTVAGAGTGTPTSTEQPTETETATETDTATATETSAPEPTATTGTDTPTATTTAAPTDTEAGTTSPTDSTTGPTVTDTETSAPSETEATAAPTETTDNSSRTGIETDTTSTETETSGVGTGSDGNGAQAGGDAGGSADSGNGADGGADAGAVAASLADSGLSDEQVSGVSSTLAASGLTDAKTSAITDALAGNGLSDEQRTAIADAIAGGDLSDDQLVALSEALDDGSLTNAERDALGFLGSDETTYYQVDLVRGEPIEQLQGPNGTYTNEELLRFAHGSSEEPITRRSDGEFTTDAALADRIESRNVTVENGTATTTFTVADGESVTLSLVSYTKPGPVWSPATEQLQNYVDSDTRTFESGTHTLRVDLPTNATGE